MNIRLYSDLHLEFGKFTPPDPEPNTILVLAGDIGVKLGAMSFLERNAHKYKAVIYVAGNHEFYNGNINTILSRWRNTTHIPNLHFLENEYIVIDNIKFLGGTLWTGMNDDDWFVKQKVGNCMNDFQVIQVGKERSTHKTWFTTSMAIVMHKETLEFFKEELSKDTMQTVIVSHHSPTIHGCNTARYGYTDMTHAYYTPLEYLMEQHDHLTHWMFGHTHVSMDMDIYDTRVLSNPRGYVGHEVVDSFKPNFKVII